MINAKTAKEATLDSWKEYVEQKINEAIKKHCSCTVGIYELPKVIIKELSELGYIITGNREGYLYICWGEIK